MYLRILFNFVLAVVLVALQMSFFNLLPVLHYVNFVLVVLVFGLVLRDLPWAGLMFVLVAFCFDALAFGSFGVHLLSYALLLIILYLLLVNFFTNRSLYAFLLLVGLGTLLHDLTLPLANYLVAPVAQLAFDLAFWQNEGWRLLANLILTALIFYLLNLFSKRFQPVFLRKPVFK